MEGTSPAVREGAVTRWLRTAPPALFSAYAIAAAFSTYFAMYAFRKPFAVAKFSGTLALPLVGALDDKTLFILAQALGYAASKFFGIKLISELRPERRARALVATLAIAEIGLLLFALLPGPFAAVGLLVDGLSLGLVWGLVFGFLEGRQVSDLLGAGLCASFILASGVVKTVGKMVLDHGVPERWMPALTGILFVPPLVLSIWMLAQIPPPNVEDERLRVRRAPMNAAERKAFFRSFAGGLIALVVAYVVLTALRDFRDNFAREVWDALGYGDQPAVLTTTEIPVAFGSLLVVALMMGIRNNRKALLAMHAVMIAGALLAGGATVLFQLGAIGAVPWMVSVGLGLYIGYVPFNCVLFDRLIAATGSVATAGFLIYVADASGYAGSAALLLYKSFGQPRLAWVSFFEVFVEVAAVVCAALFVGAAAYFTARTRVVKALET